MFNPNYKNLKSYRQATALRNLFQQERLKKERDFDRYLEEQIKQNKTDKPDKPGRVRLISLIGLIGLISLISLIAPQAVFAFTITTPPNSLTLSSGLVGWWTFDGKNTNWATGITNDVSGNGNNGQLIGMSTSTSPVPGKIGQALSFNNNNYVKAPNSSSLNITGNSITVSFWAKSAIAGAQVGYNGLVTKMYTGGGGGYTIYTGSGGGLYFIIGANSTTYATGNAGTAQWDRKWHFITAIYDGAYIKMYVDGVNVGTNTAVTGNINDSSAYPLTIGSFQGLSPYYFNGSLDDVRVYNRALSAGEVQQLYNIGSASHINVPPALGQTTNCSSGLSCGLVGWWTFDGKNTNWATGVTADISGSGNNGQMINMSTTTSPVAGKVGQALYFNGTNNYVNIPHNSLFNSFPFTVSAWIKIPVVNNNVAYSGLVGNYTAGSFNGWMFGIGNNQVQFWDYRDSSNNIPISVATATHYNDNKWHFAVVTVTSSGAIIYIDNVSKVSGGWTGTAGSTTTTQPLQIANYGGNYGNATIDDVRVYNRALSAGEVQQLYNLGR